MWPDAPGSLTQRSAAVRVRFGVQRRVEHGRDVQRARRNLQRDAARGRAAPAATAARPVCGLQRMAACAPGARRAGGAARVLAPAAGGRAAAAGAAHRLPAAGQLQRPLWLSARGGTGRAGQGPARSGSQLRRHHLHGAPGGLAGACRAVRRGCCACGQFRLATIQSNTVWLADSLRDLFSPCKHVLITRCCSAATAALRTW